jgi:DNA-binding XRE family transcriptional regulator
MDNNTHFTGKELRDVRKSAKFTQEQLALHLGISLETIVTLENNHDQTIDPLSSKLVRNWWYVCSGELDRLTQIALITFLANKLSKIFRS